LSRHWSSDDDAEAILAESRASLGPDRAEAARDQARTLVERERAEPLSAELAAELDELFLVHGSQALKLLRDQGDAAELSAVQAEAAEAIIMTDGSRPTLEVAADGTIIHSDRDRKTLGAWCGDAEHFADRVATVTRSVGRIDLNGRHRGTGFVIGDGLVLTNRHVLQALARDTGGGQWTFRGEATIVFDPAPDESRQSSFTIEPTVVAAGSRPIPTAELDLGRLDFAVLRCHASEGFPPPLPIESDADKIFVGRPVYTVGYPGHPGMGSGDLGVVERLFAHRYGVKRFAPGLIDLGIGEEGRDLLRVSVGHDATTLRGSSGSCVVDFQNDGLLVVGLHFGGGRDSRNWAHCLARLVDQLADLDVEWREF
jgi:hypothetical protein